MDNFVGQAPQGTYRNKLDSKLQDQGLTVPTGNVSKTVKNYDFQQKKSVDNTMTQDLSRIRYHHGGTVFGLRKDNLWSFYYQKRVTAEIWRQLPNSDPNLWASWEPYEIAMSMDVEKFWPNGGGTAISR